MTPVRALVLFAVFLVAVAVAAVVYIPETHAFGFNEKAKTALISGGAAAALSLLWAFLLARGKRWAHYAALATTLALVGVFGWRASMGWMAVQDGAGAKAYAATLITLMAAASLVVAAVLAFTLRTPAPGTNGAPS